MGICVKAEDDNTPCPSKDDLFTYCTASIPRNAIADISRTTAPETVDGEVVNRELVKVTIGAKSTTLSTPDTYQRKTDPFEDEIARRSGFSLLPSKAVAVSLVEGVTLQLPAQTKVTLSCSDDGQKVAWSIERPDATTK